MGRANARSDSRNPPSHAQWWRITPCTLLVELQRMWAANPPYLAPAVGWAKAPLRRAHHLASNRGSWWARHPTRVRASAVFAHPTLLQRAHPRQFAGRGGGDRDAAVDRRVMELLQRQAECGE